MTLSSGRAHLAAVLVVSCVVIGGTAPQVHAEPQGGKSDERDAKARELFAVGQYAEALAIYGKLYSETSHPTYLRNIGRCYQNLREPDKAISSFEEYLRQAKGLSTDQRSIVEGYIHEMEALKQKREQAQEHPARGEAAPARAAPHDEAPPRDASAVASPSPSAVSKDVRVDRLHTEEQPGHVRRNAAFVVGAAAVVVLGVGGYFGVRAIQETQESDPHCQAARCDAVGYPIYQQAKTAALTADVAIPVGLVAAAVSTYLFVTSRRDAPAETATVGRNDIRLAPAVGLKTAGLTLEGIW